MIVSIIIRSYNEQSYISRLLYGIQRQVLPVGVSIEIIVVDSGSTDSTVAIASQMGAKIIKIPKEDFSFGGALNIGCRHALGEVFLFASAHVYPVYSDWIAKMIDYFKSNDVGLVYGRQIGGNSTHFSEKQIFKKWFPEESNINQLTPFCNNANCAVSKILWLEQPYNETLTGLEDLDWAQKIMAKGYRIVYDADAIIVHVHDESPQTIKNRYRREAIALKQIIPNMGFGFMNFIKLFVSNVIADASIAAHKGCLKKELKNILVFRYMQFLGTYLGHQQKGLINKELKNRFYYPNAIKSDVTDADTCGENMSKLIQYN